jgi:hypothetical protein
MASKMQIRTASRQKFRLDRICATHVGQALLICRIADDVSVREGYLRESLGLSLI